MADRRADSATYSGDDERVAPVAPWLGGGVGVCGGGSQWLNHTGSQGLSQL